MKKKINNLFIIFIRFKKIHLKYFFSKFLNDIVWAF